MPRMRWLLGGSEKSKMVIEHKSLVSLHLITCFTTLSSSTVWPLLVVSGKIDAGNGVLGNIRGRKKSSWASGPFYSAFLRVKALGERCVCSGDRWSSVHDALAAYSKDLICFLNITFSSGLKIMTQQWHHLLALLGYHYSASGLIFCVFWVSSLVSPYP